MSQDGSRQKRTARDEVLDRLHLVDVVVLIVDDERPQAREDDDELRPQQETEPVGEVGKQRVIGWTVAEILQKNDRA